MLFNTFMIYSIVVVLYTNIHVYITSYDLTNAGDDSRVLIAICAKSDGKFSL